VVTDECALKLVAGIENQNTCPIAKLAPQARFDGLNGAREGRQAALHRAVFQPVGLDATVDIVRCKDRDLGRLGGTARDREGCDATDHRKHPGGVGHQPI